MSRWVFDGGEKEPSVRCGLSAEGAGGSVGCDGRRRCERGDRGTTWEEKGGGCWKVTVAMKLPWLEPLDPVVATTVVAEVWGAIVAVTAAVELPLSCSDVNGEGKEVEAKHFQKWGPWVLLLT